MRFVEDPSINSTARAEAATMVAELCRRYAAGEHFFHAREVIMAEHGPRMAKLYGKETAKRALAFVTSLGPEDLPRETRHKAADRLLDDMLRLHIDLHGPGFYYSPWQRWWFKWVFGIGAPKHDGKSPRLKGAELERWRAERDDLRMREIGAQQAAKRRAAEEAAEKAAQERRIAGYLRDHAKRVERGEYRRQDPDGDHVQDWLRGATPLVRPKK